MINAKQAKRAGYGITPLRTLIKRSTTEDTEDRVSLPSSFPPWWSVVDHSRGVSAPQVNGVTTDVNSGGRPCK